MYSNYEHLNFESEAREMERERVDELFHREYQENFVIKSEDKDEDKV